MSKKAGAEFRAMLRGDSGPRGGGLALAIFAAVLVIKIRIIIFILRWSANFLATSIKHFAKKR